MICQCFLKALILFQLSNNCSFQRYSKLLFPSLVGHTVNYTVPPHLWVNHTIRNVGLPHLAFYFLVGPPPSSLCNRRFRVYQNPANFKSLHQLHVQQLSELLNTLETPAQLRFDNVAFRSYQNSFNTGSYYHFCRLQLSELPISCQQWELTFMSTVAFSATYNPANFKS